MIQPINFPNHYDVIRDESERYQKLDSFNRTRIFVDLIQTGLDLMAISPNKEQVKMLSDERERQWQLAHSRLFTRLRNDHASDSNSA